MKILGVILLVVLIAVVLISSVSKKSPPPAPDPEADAAMLAVYAAKKAQRNPDSFVLEEALVMTKATCLTWRGQNGFGGMNRGYSVIARDLKYAFNDHEDGFRRAWNRDCAKQNGRDVTSLMQGQLRYNPAMSR